RTCSITRSPGEHTNCSYNAVASLATTSMTGCKQNANCVVRRAAHLKTGARTSGSPALTMEAKLHKQGGSSCLGGSYRNRRPDERKLFIPVLRPESERDR